MANDKPKRRPSHRLVMQHDEEGKGQTEVGALWPHSKGGGFSITIRPGLSVATGGPVRLHAFPVKDEDERAERTERSDRGRR